MAGTVRQPLMTRPRVVTQPRSAAWMAAVATLLTVLVLPAALPALPVVGPLRASASTKSDCANVTQSQIVTGTTPVLFVHGIDSSPATWTTGTVSGTSQAPLNYIESAVSLAQVTGYTFNWSKYSGFVYGSKLSWVTEPGQLLAQAITCVATKAGHKVVIIAHSMGGLVTEYASTLDSAAKDIAAVFTLGTPFEGSWLDSTANNQLGWLSKAIAAYCSLSSLSSQGTGEQVTKRHVKPSGGPSSRIEPLCQLAGERDDPGMQGMRTDAAAKTGWHALNWSGGFPVFPLAASIQETDWQPLPLFGPRITYADLGDGVVGTGSELAGGTQPTVTCTVPVTGAAQLVTLLNAITALSCFHTNEQDNKTLLDTIISTIQQRSMIPTASTVPAAPCTSSALTSAVSAAKYAPGAQWSILQYVCKDGYALVNIEVFQGENGVAVLRQQGSSWTVIYGPDDGTCLNPGLSFCPKLPLPLSVLKALEAAIKTAPPNAPPTQASALPSWAGALALV